MSISLLDSHCHLSFLVEEDSGILALYESLVREGSLSHVWDIGTQAQDYPARRTLLGHFPWLSFSIGLHPNEAHKESIDFDLWKEWARDEKVILIGETGLDFFRGAEFQAIQERVFIEQIEFANLVKKPIVVHVRQAEDALKKILKEHPPLYGGIWHCFSADYESALLAVDAGFKISFSGNLTYKKTENLSDAAARLPKESLLIETDAPYLSPVPLRGKRNHSGNLLYTFFRLAEIRKENPQELALQILENAKALLGGGAL
jgi:TatD DNase family protein